MFTEGEERPFNDEDWSSREYEFEDRVWGWLLTIQWVVYGVVLLLLMQIFFGLFFRISRDPGALL